MIFCKLFVDFSQSCNNFFAHIFLGGGVASSWKTFILKMEDLDEENEKDFRPLLLCTFMTSLSQTPFLIERGEQKGGKQR